MEDEREDEEYTLSKKAEDNARLRGECVIDKLPHGLLSQEVKCGDRIVSLAKQLVRNCTSNSAETFMGINAKFNGGKQINRIKGEHITIAVKELDSVFRKEQVGTQKPGKTAQD